MKKRRFILFGALIGLLCGVALFLTACFDVSAFPQGQSKEDLDLYSEYIHFYTDPDTGVQYIIYSKKVAYAGMGGITPRLNADGSLYVVDIKK